MNGNFDRLQLDDKKTDGNDLGFGTSNIGLHNYGDNEHDMTKRILIDHSSKSGFLLDKFSLFRSYIDQGMNDIVIEIDKDELNLDRLQNINLLILCYPIYEYDNHEIRSIINYVESGGNLLFLCNGEKNEYIEYTNELISKFGNIHQLSSHSDSNNTIINIYYEGDGLYHPKECYIENTICNNTFKNKFMATNGNVNIVYPYGSSLLFNKNLVLPLLSSQDLTFPSNQCICALYQSKLKGKVVVIGSYQIFNDYYINQKDNKKLLLSLINFLLANIRDKNENNLMIISSQDKAMSHEMNESIIEIPNIEHLSENVQSCLQEPEIANNIAIEKNESLNINNNNNNNSNSQSFESLFDMNDNLCQFGFSNHLFYQINQTYKKFFGQNNNQYKKESLKLIKPQFELPLPPLQCCTFEPTFLEPSSPNLELFDIDTQLANDNQRLNTLFNKCNVNNDDSKQNGNDENLTAFINGSAEIIGILASLKQDTDDNSNQSKTNANNSKHDITDPQNKSKQILNLVAKHLKDAKFFDN